MGLNAAAYKTRAAVYERGGRISIAQLVLPPLQAGEVLLRMRACGICASEALPWYADAKAPFVLGHEPVATVESVGAGVKSLQAGQRVFVHHHAPCGRCRLCARGDHVQCRTWAQRALNPGGISELAIAAAPAVSADVLPLPESVSDEDATFLEPLATVLKSLRRCGMRKGDRVLVIGLGVMGQLHALMARRRGAEAVIVADRNAARLTAAQRLGVDAALDFSAAGACERVLEHASGGADVVIVGPGSFEAFELATECVSRGGKILLFTPPAPNDAWPVKFNALFFKDISIVSSYSAGPEDTREALEVLRSGLPLQALVTHRFPLTQAGSAFALVAQAQEALKVLVYPNARS